MAPKKKHQQQNSSARSAPKSDTKSAPKLQISAENERRLRLLLLNNERPAAAPSAAGDTASRAQKAKRLRSVYDKLSLEGFSSDQIEQALSALNEGATFEAALDWLCLNIPGNELPLKFSSGATSSAPEERSVKIISTARADWNPPQPPQDEIKEEKPGTAVRIKGKNVEMSLDFDKSSQADWIRQYLEQQEEQEEIEKQEEERVQDPSSRAASIAEEYQRARLGAAEAKQKKDKKSQDHFGDIIQKLKREMSSLGLSDDILVARPQDDCPNLISDEMPCESIGSISFESIPPDSAVAWADFGPIESETVMSATVDEISTDKNDENAEDGEKKEEPEVLELDDLFSEDSSSSGQLPPEILKQQKKEKVSQLASGRTLVNIDEIWKTGDSRSTPKASLQRICQKLGWEAPKYTKLFEKENKFLYSVTILRMATGRGKSRKAGGLITLQLPDQNEVFESVEKAQNRVAAFALYQLFPDLPLCQMLKEPYSSLVEKWQKDEFSTKMEDTDDIRRAGFVDSLLDSGSCLPVASADVRNDYDGGRLVQPETGEVVCDSYSQRSEGTLSANTGWLLIGVIDVEDGGGRGLFTQGENGQRVAALKVL